MKRNVLFIALITIVLTIGFACGGGGIVGTWEMKMGEEGFEMTNTTTFKADGTFESYTVMTYTEEMAEMLGTEKLEETFKGRYEIDGDLIKTWEEGSTSEEPIDVSKFKIEGKKLILTPEGAGEGEEVVFTRK